MGQTTDCSKVFLQMCIRDRRDITAGNTAGVESTHRQLSTRFADGLRRYNTNCFANIDQFAVGKVCAIALTAYTNFASAGQKDVYKRQPRKKSNKIVTNIQKGDCYVLSAVRRFKN